MTFDAVIDVLAVIGAGTCAYWAIVGLDRLLRRNVVPAAERRRAKGARATPERPEPADIAAEHVAAIAGAVAALDAGFKVVHIADAATGRDWVTRGRWAHQTSHQTSRRSR